MSFFTIDGSFDFTGSLAGDQDTLAGEAALVADLAVDAAINEPGLVGALTLDLDLAWADAFVVTDWLGLA
jgi:hypothetical protein